MKSFVISSPQSALLHLSPQIVEVSPAVRDTPWHRWYSSPVGFPLKSQLHSAFFFSPSQLFHCLKVFSRLRKELQNVSLQRMFASCVDFTTGFLQAMVPRYRPLWCGCVTRPSSLLQRSASSTHHVCLDVGTEVARCGCQKNKTHAPPVATCVFVTVQQALIIKRPLGIEWKVFSQVQICISIWFRILKGNIALFSGLCLFYNLNNFVKA